MESIEGIILKSTSLEESTQLLTIFSKERGLITIARKNRGRGGERSFSPLLKVEAVVLISEKEIWKCRELHALSSYPRLRLDITKLRVATSATKLLSQFLPIQHKQEELYVLFEEYLDILSIAVCSVSVFSLFLLKLLQLEGYLSVPNSFYFTEDEKAFVSDMLSSTYRECANNEIEKGLLTKIEKLFISCTGIRVNVYEYAKGGT